ncbi:MAG: TRAP transporter small permease subunit [Betaproteobacteria bacterium]|nr:TRAP transporter small permease subunit [Betaproteobacteria bacterium]
MEKAYAVWRAFQDRFLARAAAVLPEVLAATGPRARRAAEVIKVIAQVFTFVFLLAVVWWGVPEVHDSQQYETRTESLAFPMWPFLAVLLAGFALMAVTLFFQIYRGIQKLRGRSVLEEPSEPKDVALE